MASRAQLVTDVIRPAVERGEFVLADRFFLSTYAYQIAGRGLPEENIRNANALATGGLTPSLTLLLDLPAGAGLEEAQALGGHDLGDREAVVQLDDIDVAGAEPGLAIGGSGRPLGGRHP